jgi:hypothetical protein
MPAQSSSDAARQVQPPQQRRQDCRPEGMPWMKKRSGSGGWRRSVVLGGAGSPRPARALRPGVPQRGGGRGCRQRTRAAWRQHANAADRGGRPRVDQPRPPAPGGAAAGPVAAGARFCVRGARPAPSNAPASTAARTPGTPGSRPPAAEIRHCVLPPATLHLIRFHHRVTRTQTKAELDSKPDPGIGSNLNLIIVCNQRMISYGFIEHSPCSLCLCGDDLFRVLATIRT